MLDKSGSSVNIYIFWQIFPANQTPLQKKKKPVVSLSSDILDMMCLFSQYIQNNLVITFSLSVTMSTHDGINITSYNLVAAMN